MLDQNIMRILIAEDDAGLQEMYAMFLDMSAHDAVIVGDGAQAVAAHAAALAQGRRFDLILLDVMMPVMGGVEAAEAIRAADAAARVVFVTALDKYAFSPPEWAECWFKEQFVDQLCELTLLMLDEGAPLPRPAARSPIFARA